MRLWKGSPKVLRIRRRNNKISFRIAVITLLTAVLCIFGLIRFMYNTLKIQESYTRIIEEDYANVSHMQGISRNMQQHQILVMSYMVEDDVDMRSGYEQRALDLKEDVMKSIIPFGTSLKGTKYESFYHDIYSGLIVYFNNIDIVFKFRNRGDVATAYHFMSSSLQENLTRVNDNMDLLNLILEGDMEKAKIQIDRRSMSSRRESALILILVVVSAISSIFLCTRISDQATGTDLLTGTANFAHLIDFGQKLQKNGKLAQYSGIAISIRNFKFINQEYGSNAGDRVLQQYAEKLSALLGQGELLARNGGDNFIMLIKQSEVRKVLEKVGQVEVELPDDAGKITLHSRCGVYDVKEDDEDINRVVDACNLALADARKRGNVDQVWFENTLIGELVERKEVLERYQDGLKKEEFIVYYQPKVDMRDNRLCGGEALVRWSRDGVIIPPYEFIPVLEEEGVVTGLDYYVLERVCRDIKNWIGEGMEPVRISTNFSKLHLKNPDFASRILGIVDRYGLDGRHIEIELTESSGYEDFEALQQFVNAMKERGISTSIDDFGTGYSSLSLLKDLDADVVKLDRSFLFGLEGGDKLTAKLIANIVRMIGDLNRKVICEGVETKEHVDFLTGVGCYLAQGFLYDKPLRREIFEERLKDPVYKL